MLAYNKQQLKQTRLFHLLKIHLFLQNGWQY